MTNKRMALLFAGIMKMACMAQTPIKVLPSSTDGKIKNYDFENYAFVPSTTSIQQILLFLPGTGAQAQYYQKFLEKGSKLGYHVIGLNYNNPDAVNATCAGVSDSNCHYKMRMEILSGQDLSTLAVVDKSHSVLNRLCKMLVFMRQNYPIAGWGQFLENDTTPNWSKFCITGHSQGGGLSLFMGKFYEVKRIVSFAGLDWQNNKNAPAKWINFDNETPLQNVYGFCHNNDELVPIHTQKNFWQRYGLQSFGPVVSSDSLGTNLLGSHTIVSDRTPGNIGANAYHNCIVATYYLPKNTDSDNLYANTWEYLLTHGNTASASKNRQVQNTFYVSNHCLYFYSETELPDELNVYSINGKKIKTLHQPKSGEWLSLQAGMYYITGKNTVLKFLIQD